MTTHPLESLGLACLEYPQCIAAFLFTLIIANLPNIMENKMKIYQPQTLMFLFVFGIKINQVLFATS